jgi:Fe-S cluster assembly ATP-binding protein
MKMTNNLKIDSLAVNIDDKQILKDFNIDIKNGEIHAIMGPNGVGKSTLSKVIMGDSDYKIMSGDISYNNKSIIDLTVDERARLGIFLAMQNPIEIEGITNSEFLKVALSTKLNKNIGLYEFIKQLDKSISDLNMNPNMAHRSINKGFSGGERKRNEILQMKILEPTMIVLDEIDSGLDVDSLKIVGDNVMDYFNNNKDKVGVLIITHYPRILDYIKPDFVHVMMNGKIVKTGNYDLAIEIEKQGYDFIKKELI